MSEETVQTPVPDAGMTDSAVTGLSILATLAVVTPLVAIFGIWYIRARVR